MAEAPPILDTEALAAIESPLAGVNPRSLDALMAEDVAKLSEPEFEQVVTAMRRLRAEWAQNEGRKAAAEDSGQPTPPRTRAKRTPGTININLDELF